MTKILGFSGRKQSGKSTSFNYLLGLEMLKLAIVRDEYHLNAKGDLVVSDIFGDKSFAGIFDPNRNNKAMRQFLAEFVNPFIRCYSFADILKQDVCINLLGLTWEQCYGTDAEKNAPTHLRWENMPGVISDDNIIGLEDRIKESIHFLPDVFDKGILIYHVSGPMTGREVMQYVGTNIFRKMHNNVWVDAVIKRIAQDGSELAVFTDIRFPNEVEGIQKAGGKVIRLTLNKYPDDTHESEVALDPENFNWENFDAIIDNEDMTIDQKNEQIQLALESWNWSDPLTYETPNK